MKPRIERIKVKRGGPLEKDFEIQPRDLNLSLIHISEPTRPEMLLSGICGNGIQTERSWCPV